MWRYVYGIKRLTRTLGWSTPAPVQLAMADIVCCQYAEVRFECELNPPIPECHVLYSELKVPGPSD